MKRSYDLIRRYPSVLLSGLLHLAYFAYYPTILLPGPYLAARGDWTGARRVVGATITAFVLCYVVFALFPVAGPNWVFDHPAGPVREVWSARLVYGILGLGSSVGTAFPSSHVAATFATVIAAYQVRRTLGWVTLVPFVLLTVSVVYCQMHYVVDAIGGLVRGYANVEPAPTARIPLNRWIKFRLEVRGTSATVTVDGGTSSRRSPSTRWPPPRWPISAPSTRST